MRAWPLLSDAIGRSPIAPLAWIKCAFQSASELLKQKDRPEGGLSVALIEAENQATRTPPPADLVTQPPELTYAVAPLGVESKGSLHRRNQTSVARTAHKKAHSQLRGMV